MDNDLQIIRTFDLGLGTTVKIIVSGYHTKIDNKIGILQIIFNKYEHTSCNIILFNNEPIIDWRHQKFQFALRRFQSEIEYMIIRLHKLQAFI